MKKILKAVLVSSLRQCSNCILNSIRPSASASLAFLIPALSVTDLEIVCDSNKLRNHLIDGWLEDCLIVRRTFP